MATIIAVTNNKGGVGKTTTTSSIAGALVERGQRVLVADLDDQANLTFSLAGVLRAQSTPEFMLATPAQLAKWPVVQVSPGLDLLPSNQNMNSYLPKLRAHRAGDDLLRQQLRSWATGKYDYVLLDCPPSLTDGMAANAFCAADVFVVPTDPEPFSVRGLARVMAVADQVRKQLNPGLLFAGFVITKYNPAVRGILRHQMLDSVREHYGADSVLGHIRQDAALGEAQASLTTIFSYAPDSRGAADYRDLTTNLLNRIQSNG